MKLTYKNIIAGIAAVSAFMTLCGTTVLANAINPPFLQVDINLAGDTPQAGFLTWPMAAPASASLGLTWTTNFVVSSWIYSNQYTPTGPVTVTIEATNSEIQAVNGFATNSSGWYTNFPTWQFSQVSPYVENRGTLTSSTTNYNLLNDFLLVQHYTPVGFGGDYIAVTFSGLVPNSNYEVTVWCYDPGNSGGGGLQNRVAWGVVDPNLGPSNPGTNQYQPGNNDVPTIIDVTAGGPNPTTFYGNSGSFIITADGTGSATIYGWEDDTSYNGTQFVPLDGFSLGVGTNTVYKPATNAITTLLNPVPASYGPPAIWPYFAGLNMNDATFTDASLPYSGGTNTIIGETFIPTRDFMLRNFYLAGRTTTNTGMYTLMLYDLGFTNMANTTQFLITNASGLVPEVNLLSHPSLPPGAYWTFSPGGTNVITNSVIIKFKLPTFADEVYLTNGHSYFLGLQFNAGSGSNDLVLEETTSGLTYANGAAFAGSPFGSSYWKMTNSMKNLIMAFDVLNPNPVITVSNYPLTASTTSWPTLAGMANGGLPVITAAMDTPNHDPAQGTNPAYLDFTGPANNDSPVLMSVNQAAGTLCQSMSFYNTNTFKLGAVAVEMRGVGSSNLLFTLNVFQITNTFFTATDSIEHWPRNFQPNIDSSPKGIPIFGTNVDFYYTTNNIGGGTTDQLLVLTLPSQYQEVITGSTVLPYQSYVVELCADQVGQNAVGSVGVFQVVRNSKDSEWQSYLFPAGVTGGPSDGYDTGPASGGTYYEVVPEMLSRTAPDPELYAGGVVGAGMPREMQLAIYAASTNAVSPNPITITSVTRSGGSTVLNWTGVGGSGAYTYSVWRTSNLATPPASWTQVISGLSAATTTYTDSSATGTVNFYYISSP